MSVLHFIPKIELKPWHPYFAWHPVKLVSGKWAWLIALQWRPENDAAETAETTFPESLSAPTFMSRTMEVTNARGISADH
jgi:hypothetical protein